MFSSSIIFFMNYSYLFAQVEESPENYSPVILSNTELKSIKSSFVDQEIILLLKIKQRFVEIGLWQVKLIYQCGP